MAISYVGGTTTTWAGAANGTNTVSLTALSGGSNTSPSIGDLVMVTYATGSSADRTLSVSTTGYSDAAAEQYANGSTYDTNFHVWYKYLTAADTSVVISASGNASDAGAVAIKVYRGVDPTSPLDVASTVATGTATGRPNPPAITPVTAGAWVVVCYGSAAATGAVYTSPSDVTNFNSATSVDTNDAMVGMGHKTNWTTGAFDPLAVTAGGTANSTDSWAAITVALRPLTAPVWTSSTTTSVAENSTLSYAMAATNATSYSIVGGTDSSQFAVSGTTLTWVANGTQNYEAPADADANNTYIVTLGATNSIGTTNQTVTVTVTNVVSPSITNAASTSISENVTLAYALTVASGTPTWSIVGGADQAQFALSGATLTWVGNGTQNFEAPADADANNIYVVTVRASFGGDDYTDQTISVTVLNVTTPQRYLLNNVVSDGAAVGTTAGVINASVTGQSFGSALAYTSASRTYTLATTASFAGAMNTYEVDLNQAIEDAYPSILAVQVKNPSPPSTPTGLTIKTFGDADGTLFENATGGEAWTKYYGSSLQVTAGLVVAPSGMSTSQNSYYSGSGSETTQYISADVYGGAVWFGVFITPDQTGGSYTGAYAGYDVTYDPASGIVQLFKNAPNMSVSTSAEYGAKVHYQTSVTGTATLGLHASVSSGQPKIEVFLNGIHQLTYRDHRTSTAFTSGGRQVTYFDTTAGNLFDNLQTNYTAVSAPTRSAPVTSCWF